MKFQYTRIVTENVPALTRFYKEITRIAPVVFNDAYVEFPNEGTALAISSQQTMDLHGAGATIPASNRSIVMDFEVDDVDQERARLDAIIDEFVLEPTNQPWGNRSMLFRDPDGNLVNFFAPIRAAD